MASPIGHSLSGYVIYVATRKKSKKINWKGLLGFIFIANLADIDYLFGFLIGKPNEYHHQFTHSVGFSLIVAASVAFFYKIRKINKFIITFLTVLIIYSSHIFVDYFTRDTSYPYGEQLFWPFSTSYFLGPISIFRDMHKGNTSIDFFPKLFSFYNFYTIFTEMLIFSVIIILVRVMKHKIDQNKLKVGNILDE